MRKTKIVCTIGPASQDKETLSQMINTGMNVARMNFSHGNHEEHLERFNMVKEIREELNQPIAIMLDTKGPEIRTREFEKGFVEMEIGQKIIITARNVMGKDGLCSVTYDNIAKDVKVNDNILIDDGLIGLTVTEIINNTDIKCVVNNAGSVKNKKGVNIPNVDITLPALTKKDIDDIEFGIKNDIDFIAASFIRKANDVIEIRKILERNNAEHVQIISKIENREGVNNIDAIIKVSDGIMVARGDLGVEIPAEEVPLVQKMLIEKCNIAGKPVITATQMLDSMIINPRPTRAEASDVANAVFDGTDAVMLSGETSVGRYPVESVGIMDGIVRAAENQRGLYKTDIDRRRQEAMSFEESICHSACLMAEENNAAAIICLTNKGRTALLLSRFRSRVPVIAFTEKMDAVRYLNIIWGVQGELIDHVKETDITLDMAAKLAKEIGYINTGDTVVFTAGIPLLESPHTNMIKIQKIK